MKRIAAFVSFVYLLEVLFMNSAAGAVSASEPALTTIQYAESMAMIPNPERGFYYPCTADDMTGLSNLWAQGHSLILVELDLKAFKTGVISPACLTQVRNAFSAARDNGLKIIFRAAYGYTDNDYRADPTDMNIITNHITQLGAIFRENEDVLYAVQAGFLGPWGEWHGSNWGDPPSLTARKTVLFALLDAVPVSRTVHVRRPMFIRDIFSNETGGNVLDSARAYGSAKLSRTGYHNDAILSGPDDMGTYVQSGWNRARELDWCNVQCRYTPSGGESCALTAESQPGSAVPELEKLHATYINIAYLGSVINRWKTTTYNGENAFNCIERRLGYRFVLKQCQISSTVAPGGRLRLVLQVRNAGFSAPHCPRGMEIVLDNGGTTYRAPVNDVDPRRWDPESGLITIDREFRVPAMIPTGAWNVYVSLPDPMPGLREKSRYSIRLANTDVSFSAVNGWNFLYKNLVIDRSASGETTNDTVFQMINSLTGVGKHAKGSGDSPGISCEVRAGLPFARSSVSVRYFLDQDAAVVVSLYKTDGRLVRVLESGRFVRGTRTVSWDGQDRNGQAATKALYLVSVRAGAKIQCAKVMLGK
jgi:hypothetical protein